MDDEIIDVFEHGGHTVEIVADTDCESPREDDNVGTMVCLHRRYRLGDEHDYREGDHAGWDEIEAHILRDHPRAVVLPLYVYDHSGLTMNTTGFSEIDSARWDWGQVGFVFAPASRIRECFCVQRVSRRLRERARESLLAEVEQYAAYLRGECYGYRIDGGDFSWGFVGRECVIEEAKTEAGAA